MEAIEILKLPNFDAAHRFVTVLQYFLPFKWAALTMTRHESTRQKVPDLPTPAEQWTTAGPTLDSKLPELLERGTSWESIFIGGSSSHSPLDCIEKFEEGVRALWHAEIWPSGVVKMKDFPRLITRFMGQPAQKKWTHSQIETWANWSFNSFSSVVVCNRIGSSALVDTTVVSPQGSDRVVLSWLWRDVF